MEKYTKLLQECKLQLEYLNDKFGKTGTTNALLSKIDSTLKQSNIGSWVSIEDELPDELETVWISNGKGWTNLGCLVYSDGSWHWAETNGTICQENDNIVSECESEDLDVMFWHRLPKPISAENYLK